MAGFLARAENAFLQLLNSQKHFFNAQIQLFNIYQTTKEWPRAIELAEQMIGAGGDSDDLCTRVAHFYCEQSNTEIKNSNFDDAQVNLKKPVIAYEQAVRRCLWLGEIAMQHQ